MNKYQKSVVGIDPVTGKSVVSIIDVYDVLEAFGVTCPAMAHAIKKALMPGKRGAKDFYKDANEVLESTGRSIELQQGRELLLALQGEH